MNDGNLKKIVRLLGVGFDAEDGHIRITKSDTYDVFMGSDESHEYILQLIKKIEEGLENRGLSLDDLSPEKFSELVSSLV
ncbi:MAG: hypothetical protein K9M54_12735 [Kiritimatiellales bacterium]|nr:hypothetical protein [Kiritimatiellales bacterium]MCF7863714.1 hypothetical protein [Kiritimatiellales bacterium]